MISQPGFAYNRRPMRRATTALALLAALLLAPAAGRAAALPAPAPPAGGIRAGDEVVTCVPRLPDGATEFELVLLPDQGPTIQVCPETPAGVREVRWRMPRLSVPRARLVLRAGGENVEWESPASAAFDLAARDAGLPAWLAALNSPSAVSFDAASRSWSGLRSASTDPDLYAGGAGPRALPPPGSPALTPPADTRAQDTDSRPESAPVMGRRIMPRVPTTIPLRN